MISRVSWIFPSHWLLLAWLVMAMSSIFGNCKKKKIGIPTGTEMDQIEPELAISGAFC